MKPHLAPMAAHLRKNKQRMKKRKRGSLDRGSHSGQVKYTDLVIGIDDIIAQEHRLHARED
ncbi:MAG: hypothetical protein HYX68_02960 [Planctomycetes bacterium]|nr:hypothetical protein [Planctomycetota bacterium]